MILELCIGFISHIDVAVYLTLSWACKHSLSSEMVTATLNSSPLPFHTYTYNYQREEKRETVADGPIIIPTGREQKENDFPTNKIA